MGVCHQLRRAHGMRRDVNVLIYLDVRKALEEGMKFYISENKVILTEGFDGVVPVKYFKKIESWPDRKPITFLNQDRLQHNHSISPFRF
ncbi:hypothetical protein GBA52_007642 [Prunus armeniaca]|nr:hypothetical protein GBA52_007642 [Prunus armeniaca]